MSTKTKIYLATFQTEAEARDCMRARNRAAKLAGNHRDIVVVVPGPDDGWSVVDLDTGIDLGVGYRWE